MFVQSKALVAQLIQKVRHPASSPDQGKWMYLLMLACLWPLSPGPFLGGIGGTCPWYCGGEIRERASVFWKPSWCQDRCRTDPCSSAFPLETRHEFPVSFMQEEQQERGGGVHLATQRGVESFVVNVRLPRDLGGPQLAVDAHVVHLKTFGRREAV
jgi:hypothetical protein